MTDRLFTDTPDDKHRDFLKAIGVQAKAALPDRSAAISANAGSGKTKVLIDRVARLLLQKEDGRPGAAPDSILCITYTKAAASEMLSRLFKQLGDWSVMNDDDLRGALARLEARAPADYTLENLKEARALFARALETPGGLRIETIHAFCSRILRRFPLEAGVLPGFTEMEEDESNVLWREAVEGAVIQARESYPKLLDCLAIEGGAEGAFAALETLKSVRAEVLGFAASYGHNPKRIEQALRDALNAPEAMPDDLIAQFMDEEIDRKGLLEAIPILLSGKKTDADLGQKLASALELEDSLAAYRIFRTAFFTDAGTLRKKLPTKDLHDQSELMALLSFIDPQGSEVRRISELEAKLKIAETFQRSLALLTVGIPALQAFQHAKAKRAALDFEDLIIRTRDLLSNRSMSQWVLYKLDGGLSHVLLDEAQDTSPAQWELITALTEEFRSGQGRDRPEDPRTMFVVGDEKQSIYSFQGADPSLMATKANEFASVQPDMVRDTMGMSFRSCPEVLQFVDEVWNGAPVIDVPHRDDPPATADKIVHMARRAGQPGLVELWTLIEKEDEEDADAWSRPVNAVRYGSPKAKLAKKVAQAVSDMIQRGETVWEAVEKGEWRRRPMRPEDVLILVRNRKGGLFDAIIGALKQAGVPVAGADRLILNDHIGVQDCLNLMRFVLLPENDLVVAEILRGPFCGLVDDDRYLFPLAAGRDKGVAVWDRVQESQDPDVQNAAAFLRGLLERKHLAAYEFLSQVLDCPCLGDKTGREALMARLGHPVRDPVEALLARALAHDADKPASLQLFVAAMDADDEEIKRDLAEAESEVRVMTVHGAKGLQAPIVILPDTTSAPKGADVKLFNAEGAPVWIKSKAQDLPETAAQRAIADAKAEEEHRRLLYVALTRAQDRLIICGAQWRSGYSPKSWYALCLEAMDTLSPLPDEADEADPRFFGELPPLAKDDGQTAQSAVLLPEWVFKEAPQVQRGTMMVAPTRLSQKQARIVPPFGPQREARMRRGKMIHALLEYLPEVRRDVRDAAGKAWLEGQSDLEPAERTEILSAAMTVLEHPDMAPLFVPESRAEASIIGTSPLLPDKTVINGRVDRLLVTDRAVLIVDFKTDQPPPMEAEGVAETYMLQMAAYWAVAKEIWPGREVKTALCWTDAPRLMVLPEHLLSDALKGMDSGV